MNNFFTSFKVVFNHIKSGDFITIYKSIRKRLSSNKKSIGFKRDLNISFKNPKAKIELSVRLIKDRDFEYFKMTHFEDGLIVQNIPNCFVATSKNDVPYFRQWQIGSGENKKLKIYFKNTMPHLKENETIFEGVFVTPESRGMGIMADAMCKIADIIKDYGIRYVIAFVYEDNIPSLKGFKRAGFHPYTLRTEKWSFFKRKVIFSEIPENIMNQYLEAVSS